MKATDVTRATKGRRDDKVVRVCLEQATWTYMKHLRTERDQYAQLQMAARTLQMRFQRGKKELAEAQDSCWKLTRYYQLVMAPRKKAAAAYVVGEWEDESELICTVAHPVKVNSKDALEAAKAHTKVNLGALMNKDYPQACEKNCMQYIAGLCVHIIAGLLKKNWNVDSCMPVAQTTEGYSLQYRGGFDLPTPLEAYHEVCTLRVQCRGLQAHPCKHTAWRKIS